METTSATLAPVGDLIAEGNQRQRESQVPETDISKEAFLQLLVAQIRNQNPLNPADGIEFLTQLAQFSSLEQMMAIKEEVAGLRADIDAAQTAADDPAGPPAAAESPDS